MTSIRIGQLFTLANTKPLSTGGAQQPGAQMFFYQSGAFTTQQTVFADSGLTTPLAQPIVANSSGRFVPIFFNPAWLYSWQLFASNGTTLLLQADPVNALNTNTPVQLYKAASTARASTVTLAADPDLSYAIPFAGTYRVELDLQWIAAVAGAAPGLQFELNFSGTLNGSAGNTLAVAGLYDNTNTTNAQSSITLNVPATGISLGMTVGQNTIRIAGTIQVTSAGTLSLQWAQNSSSANAVTLSQGSAMAVTQVG
jgi:hypothetical protein